MNLLVHELRRLALTDREPSPGRRLALLLAPLCAHCGDPVLDAHPEAVAAKLQVLCQPCYGRHAEARGMAE